MIDLNTFADGALAERFHQEFERVMENMHDLNTDPKKARKIVLTLSFAGDQKREVWNCQVQATSKLAPTEAVESKILLDMDQNGNLVGHELASGVKGQFYMDLEGEVKTDTGKAVEEVETIEPVEPVQEEPEKQMVVVDLQRKTN
ncbi:replication terminator protein [Bacillus pseudomycoides]|uniref:Replication terminator protein n=1 Tax=Bacillus pseudomycoides TaxID=64104 RepID=A0AA91VAK7_9BACI|nr:MULTISPECIES: replication terminator protein [Bacillus]PEB56217.1 replication terminator protein [Bacillus sp. AFS098217]PED81647.1 replication terminator protein [Bacillus pseudomycoides]